MHVRASLAHLTKRHPNLSIAAKTLFSVINDSKTEAVIKGGAAIIAYGLDRSTKDLDVDVRRVSGTLLNKAQAAGFTVKATGRGAYKLDYNIPDAVSPNGYPAHVGIDLHERSSSLLNSIKEKSTGISWADPSVLLVNKISLLAQTTGTRSRKQHTDSADLLYMAEILEESGVQLREEYAERLTEEILVQFTRNLDESDAELLWGLLPQLGIKMPQGALENDPDV